MPKRRDKLSHAAHQARLASRRGDFAAAKHWLKQIERPAHNTARHSPQPDALRPDQIGADGSPLLTDETREAAMEPLRKLLRRLGYISYTWSDGELPEGWREGDPLPEGVKCISHTELDHPDLFDYAGIPDDPDQW